MAVSKILSGAHEGHEVTSFMVYHHEGNFKRDGVRLSCSCGQTARKVVFEEYGLLDPWRVREENDNLELIAELEGAESEPVESDGYFVVRE